MVSILCFSRLKFVIHCNINSGGSKVKLSKITKKLIHCGLMCILWTDVTASVQSKFKFINLLFGIFNIIVVIGCYGINDEDSDSGKSNDTDSPTELWFCDVCKLGMQPVSYTNLILIHLSIVKCLFVFVCVHCCCLYIIGL